MPYMIVTSGMCSVVSTFFMTSTGQGAPAMIPVRRLLKSNSVRRGLSSSAMNIVGGEDHAGAVAGAGEVAEHHPEAVIEGHRDADPVGGCVVEPLADEEAVVEDVVVGEGCALREPGRARGVLGVGG